MRLCVCLPILAAEEVLREILAYPKLLGPTLGRGRRETNGIEPRWALCICGTGGHVVIGRVSDFTDFLTINYWFPWLLIFVDTHSSRVAESGCYEKMMRNGAAGIDKHRKEAWQAWPMWPWWSRLWNLKSDDILIRSMAQLIDHGFFMWNFSVYFAQGTACKGDPSQVRVCGTLGFIPLASRFMLVEAVHYGSNKAEDFADS